MLDYNPKYFVETMGQTFQTKFYVFENEEAQFTLPRNCLYEATMRK